MTILIPASYEAIDSRENGPQLWATAHDLFVLWPQQPDGHLYVYRTTSESDAESKYAQGNPAGFPAYTVAQMAATVGPPATMCLLLESSTAWLLALLPETPPQSFAWTTDAQDALDTYNQLTTGWEY